MREKLGMESYRLTIMQTRENRPALLAGGAIIVSAAPI